MKRAIGIALVLLLAGCASGEPVASAPDSGVASTESSGESTEETNELPDPRSLTGVSFVDDLGDPDVIDGNFAQTLPATVTDHEGNKVTVTDTSRILALDLNGNLSRTVVALGYGDAIIGRSISSTESQLADVPLVTQEGHSLNAEAMLNLRPTLVLVDRSVGPPEAIEQVKSAGIPVVIMDSQHSLDTVAQEIQAVADALGVPDAGAALGERVEAEIAQAREQIAQWVPAEPLDVAFLYVRGTAGVFFILAGDEGASDLIAGIGANDVAAEAGVRTITPANAESLLAVNPEVILTMTKGLESTEGVDGLLARPGVSDTIAGSKQRIVSIPDGLSLSFGPQSADILLAIAKAVYGVSE